MVFRILAAVSLLASSTVAYAVIITAPLGAPCSEFFNFEDITYVCIDHPTLGQELHKIRGGRLDAELVIDIRPGAGDSNPKNFFEANGFLYFFASDNTNGDSLWRTNGTKEGTQQIRSISNDFGFRPEALIARIGGVQYFIANSTTGSPALFRTDGSVSGTSQTNAVIVGALMGSSSDISGTTFAVFESALYFVTLNNLYKLGSNNQAELIFAGLPFDDGGPPTTITDLVFDNQIVIQAEEEIWLSDGTTAGTQQAIGGPSTSAISASVVNGLLIYRNFSNNTLNASDGNNTTVLWTFENAAPVTRFGLTASGNRSIYSQALISQPRVIFTGGTTATTKAVQASTRRGLIEFSGSFYGSDDTGSSSFSGPHSIRRINPTTGSVQNAFGGLKQLRLIQAAQQGVVYQACLDICSPGRINDRIGLTLLRSNGVRTFLANIGTFGAGSTVAQSHVEGTSSYYSVRDGSNNDSPFRGVWHSNGTTAGTYRLEFQYDNGIAPPEPEKPKAVTAPLLLLLLDDEDE